jgi:hypothetical protein
MAKHPRSYPPDFREKVVALARTGRRLDDLAHEFGLARQTVRNWVSPALPSLPHQLAVGLGPITALQPFASTASQRTHYDVKPLPPPDFSEARRPHQRPNVDFTQTHAYGVPHAGLPLYPRMRDPRGLDVKSLPPDPLAMSQPAICPQMARHFRVMYTEGRKPQVICCNAGCIDLRA